MDWTGALVSTILGFVLGGVILLAIAARTRQRLRADPSLASAPISVRVRTSQATKAGWCAAAAAAGLAAFVALTAGGAHPARVFFGVLLAEAALLAFYAFAFTPNESLPDISADRYLEMTFLERYGVIQSYGAGRVASSLRVAARVLGAVGLPGLLAALVMS